MKKYPNVVKCLSCGIVLVSNYRHDYKLCGCNNETMIDGGYDYLRYGGKDMKMVQVLKLVKATKKELV